MRKYYILNLSVLPDSENNNWRIEISTLSSTTYGFDGEWGDTKMYFTSTPITYNILMNWGKRGDFALTFIVPFILEPRFEHKNQMIYAKVEFVPVYSDMADH